jgi:hypothetical protein
MLGARMAGDFNEPRRTFRPVFKFAVVAAIVAVIGLPINHLFDFALLLIAVIVLAVGRVTSQLRSWAVAAAIVAVAMIGKATLDIPRIEEGHNVFLPGGENNALLTLPPDVHHAMADEFDRAYPASVRCAPEAPWCWQNVERPKRAYAFSFDGIYQNPTYSRRVTGIDFFDAEWQRLGFVNELAYNWHSAPGDVGRGYRRHGLQRLLHPWRITTPHFVMFSFPAAFVGSQLCWQGTVLWEGSGERFTPLPQADLACRALTPDDVGKRIFALSISPASQLAMTLRPTSAIRLLQVTQPALTLAAVVSLLLLLVRWNPRHFVLPLTFIALSLVVIVANDSTLLGGVRPFDAGNDGLIYDGWARIMVQQLLAGDIVRALEGVEPVFYFTPGSRYLRAVEHLCFGETYLGYVSLLLLLPFLVFYLFQRYFTAGSALVGALIFVAVPVGALFGSTFYIYVKHAAHGFGDSAAAILFLAGVIALIGRSRRGPADSFTAALGAGLLFAVAVFVRPNLAIGAAVLLSGAGLAAVWQRQGWRLAGMCIGFLPVLSMALHNWYYGGVFVLFSSHTSNPAAILVPPRAYASALRELFSLDFASGNLARGALQIRGLLIGPSESVAMIPLHAAALVIVVRVFLSGLYESWLRLIAVATLGLYTPALFFLYSDRYHILAWLLTLLICCVWAREEGLPWLNERFPRLVPGVLCKPLVVRVMRRLDGFAHAAGIVPTRRRGYFGSVMNDRKSASSRAPRCAC